MSDKLGKLIKEARTEAELTQEQLNSYFQFTPNLKMIFVFGVDKRD